MRKVRRASAQRTRRVLGSHSGDGLLCSMHAALTRAAALCGTACGPEGWSSEARPPPPPSALQSGAESPFCTAIAARRAPRRHQRCMAGAMARVRRRCRGRMPCARDMPLAGGSSPRSVLRSCKLVTAGTRAAGFCGRCRALTCRHCRRAPPTPHPATLLRRALPQRRRARGGQPRCASASGGAEG